MWLSGVWIEGCFKKCGSLKEVLSFFEEGSLMIAKVVGTAKEMEGISKIHVSFVSFDEFLCFYTVHSSDKGIVSFYFDQDIEEGRDIEILASLLNQPDFLNGKGKILKVIKATVDQKQIVQVELSHFNEKAEKLLARLHELQTQRRSGDVRF